MLELLAGIILATMAVGLFLGLAQAIAFLVAGTLYHLGLGIAALFQLTWMFLEGVSHLRALSCACCGAGRAPAGSPIGSPASWPSLAPGRPSERR
jgi:hypothetical protein